MVFVTNPVVKKGRVLLSPRKVVCDSMQTFREIREKYFPDIPLEAWVLVDEVEVEAAFK